MSTSASSAGPSLRRLPAFLIVGACSAAATAAEPPAEPGLEQVVISATRSPDGSSGRLLGASLTIIDAAQLRDRQVRSLADVLRDVPGVAVSRSGPLGAVTQVRLRGSEANHTLVLVDGMEIADPFAGEFDFSALQVDEHARIEVLRGPQSALYGSDAIGGVVHYITQSGREAPGASFRAEAGSFATREASARVAGLAGGLDYALTAGTQDTDGSPTARAGTRDIGAAARFVSGRFGWQATDWLRWRAVVRASRSDADFNGQDFDFTSPTYGFVIDTDDRSSLRSAGGLLAADIGAPDARLRQEVVVQGVDSARDAFTAAGRQTGDDASRLKGSYVARLALGDERVAHRLVFAVGSPGTELEFAL